MHHITLGGHMITFRAPKLRSNALLSAFSVILASAFITRDFGYY